MKNTLFLFLFFTSFSYLEAVKNNLCNEGNCNTQDSNFLDISNLEKREVFEALYKRACKNATQKIPLGTGKQNYDLTEIDFQTLEHQFGWKVEKDWKGCYMWIDLSQDQVDVEFFNGLYGENAAQKAIKPLRSQKVLLS